MEAAELNSRGDCERDRGGAAAVLAGARTVVSRAGSSAISGAERRSRLRAGRVAGGGVVGAADDVDLRGGRCVSPAADSLDVVAGDWGIGYRFGRADLSAGTGGWLRHDWAIAAGQRDNARDSGDFAGEGEVFGAGDDGGVEGDVAGDVAVAKVSISICIPWLQCPSVPQMKYRFPGEERGMTVLPSLKD